MRPFPSLPGQACVYSGVSGPGACVNCSVCRRGHASIPERRYERRGRDQSVTTGSFGKVSHPPWVKSGKSIGRLRSATERSLRSVTAESAAAS